MKRIECVAINEPPPESFDKQSLICISGRANLLSVRMVTACTVTELFVKRRPKLPGLNFLVCVMPRHLLMLLQLQKERRFALEITAEEWPDPCEGVALWMAYE